MLLIKQKSKKYKHWHIGLIAFLILMVISFLCQEQLQRGITAIVIYHKHIFIPPPKNENEHCLKRFWSNARFYWDISGLRIAQKKRVKQFNPTLRPLVNEMNHRQAVGEAMQYSMNITSIAS